MVRTKGNYSNSMRRGVWAGISVMKERARLSRIREGLSLIGSDSDTGELTDLAVGNTYYPTIRPQLIEER
jgi:hypothetical protein